MTKDRKGKIPAPLVAVVVIGVCWAGLLMWPSQQADEATSVGEDKAGDDKALESPVATVSPPVPEIPVIPGVTEWSTYHGDSALAGVAAAVIPDKLVRLWQFQADSGVYHAPVSCGGRIYFSSDRGGVYALDLEGRVIWSKRLVRGLKEDGSPRMERFEAPTACFESTVLAGSASGTLFAFDAGTGEEKWTYDVGGMVLGTANFVQGGDGGSARLFIIGQGDGTLHCIDFATGKGLWQTEAIDRCDGSPAVKDDVIVFGSCAAALHVFSTADGTLTQNIDIDADSQVTSGVALVGKSIFSGSLSGKIIRADSGTGKILWINDDGEDEVLTTPAVNGPWVVYTSADGGIYGLDSSTGERKWAVETRGLPTSPVIAADKVIVSSDGMLYVLGLNTGEVFWSYEVSDEITSPSIIDNMIIVGSEDGTVTAFGAPQC